MGAHHKAISSMDGKGVTSLAYTSVVDALGRVVAGVPEKPTKDVFYAFADISPKTLPEYIFKTVDGAAAYKAAGAFFEYKDVIKAASVRRLKPLDLLAFRHGDGKETVRRD